MQTKAGSSCLAQKPQLSANNPSLSVPNSGVKWERQKHLFLEKIKKKIKKKKLKEFHIQFQK